MTLWVKEGRFEDRGGLNPYCNGYGSVTTENGKDDKISSRS